MLYRLNWLFIIFIYLFVNGQVFATTIHLCPQMALTSTVLSSSQNVVNIHQHQQKLMHQADGEHSGMIHDLSAAKTMENCQCIDCDCVDNITGQVNYSYVQNSVLIGYLPVVTIKLVMPEQNFHSQPQTNPYRPPIVT